ncbi:MFS transporter [uncultured Friedmanniella sp.]|uniref:MFS transporter n=1 Tax=uncultured Friedmanniella sp. TaxID=335381 RepID=UPI0035CB9141
MSTESLPVVPDAEAEAPAGRFGVKVSLLVLILIANGAVWAEFFPPIITLLPLRVRALRPDDYTTALSIILTVSAVIGLLAAPLAGALSDRSRARFGRRRTWLVVFVLVGSVGNLIMGGAGNRAVLIVGASIGQIGFGATSAILFALIPEHVHPSGRGRVGGLLGIGMAVATVVGISVSAALASSPATAWAVLSAIGTVGVLLLAAKLPDSPSTGTGRPPFSLVSLAQTYWLSPRRYPDFGWAWVSRFGLYLAFASVITYQVFYLTDQIGVGSPEDAVRAAGVGTAVQTIFTVLGAGGGGWLSDRVGRRKPFVICAASIGAVALLCYTFATALPLYLVGTALTGLAIGCYASVDDALVTALLPNGASDAGKHLAVINIANNLPNTVAPAVAPLLLSVSLFTVVENASGRNYTTLFLGSAVFALISALTLLKVRSVR